MTTDVNNKREKSVFVWPLLSFRRIMEIGFAIEAGIIVILGGTILRQFNQTTLYELLINVLILVILVIFMIRNHLASSEKAEVNLGKSIREMCEYKQALDASAIVAITNQKGVITYVNDNFCRISKYSREELVGQTHKVINSGYHSPAFFRALWITISNGRTWKGELRNRAKDGSIYWVDTTIIPFSNEAGKPVQYLSIRFDITQRKCMEERLGETEANLKTIFENTESAYILLNNDLEIVTFNPLAEQFSINSLQREGRTGDYVIDYFPESRKETLLFSMRQVLQGKKIQYEISYPQPDGSNVWYHVSLFPVSKTKKTNYGLIMELRDITHQKRMEGSLSRSQANLLAIIQNTDSSIYSIDKECRYITFNKAHHDILQKVYGLDIKSGDHVYNFLQKPAPEETKGWQEVYDRAFQGEIVKFEREFNIGNFKGFVSFSIYPIWENEAVIGLSCFARNITERKKAEIQKKKMTEDLIQRNRDLEQFSFIVSHNLRGPVANILGLSNILKHTRLSAEEKERTQGYLFLAVEKLDDVVKDLTLTINTRRNIKDVKEEVVFSELVDNIKCNLHSDIEREQVRILADFSEVNEMCSIRTYFYNIFYNLISNSIKYAQPGKTPVITIKSEKKENKLLLRFSDNGRGIDVASHKDKLFGPYQRFHNTSRGKGMGLFMVKTQVETLGGTITLKSEINKGTEFIIEFDIQKEILEAA